MQEQNESNMELAMEFIANNPELTERVSEEMFPILWQYPSQVIAQYNQVIYEMKTFYGFTDDMVKENCLDFLNDTCMTVASRVNLNSNTP